MYICDNTLYINFFIEIISKPSHKSLSASSFSLSGDDTNPNLKTSLSSESESEFYLRNATQSLSNSDNNISDKSPSTQLELNIEKISPDKINSSNLSLLSRFRKMPKMSTVVNSTKNQQDCLNLDPTSPLKLCLKQEPRIPFAPLHPPQRLRRLNVLNQDEVPPEVEHTISNVFGDFINTDMLPVLRCILTFNNYRHQGERYNRIISPYIEKSISMPLRLKNVNYTLKITPIKHLTTSQPIKSNLSPSQLMLHRRAKSTSNRSTITSFHSTNKYIQPKRSNDNCPIKLLETSHTKMKTFPEKFLYLLDLL
ncbi:hypothetical protein LOD99_404 [Oopsacas minuta]|uniref:Uncharacterized protein n=1 Tax=Oopsacas minuta TaxID=111878 RepID=A0AAV7K9E3_9METZ|nr:hypothetical protein LOD99_404 [Oopsacas minuta]